MLSAVLTRAPRLHLSRSLSAQGRTFLSTTSTRPAIPAVLIAFAKPLARGLTVVLGKAGRRWWKQLPDNRKHSFRQLFVNHRRKFYGSSLFVAGGVLYGYESHIQECPITGRRRFVALTPDQARKIGDHSFRDLLEENKEKILTEDNKVWDIDRIARIVNKLLQANKDLRQIYDKTWTLTILDSPEENAFVLPSGNIFIYTGMLQVCNTEEELSIVISHEIAHAILGHAEEKLTLTSFIQWLLLVPMAVLWAFLPNDGIALVANKFMDAALDTMVELPFSRDMEAEADRVGLVLAAKACFDVRAGPAFWGKMKLLSETPHIDKEVEFLSTHPCHESREEVLKSLLPDAIKMRMECGCLTLKDQAWRSLALTTPSSAPPRGILSVAGGV